MLSAFTCFNNVLKIYNFLEMLMHLLILVKTSSGQTTMRPPLPPPPPPPPPPPLPLAQEMEEEEEEDEDGSGMIIRLLFARFPI